VIHTLESEGVDPGKIIIDHMDDMEDMSFEYCRSVAEHGVYLEFDCFGQEDYVEAENFVHPAISIGSQRSSDLSILAT
jgi:predicted metal-dependent phosphotriesterase family hydrolase